jgi:hypothetical protein
MDIHPSVPGIMLRTLQLLPALPWAPARAESLPSLLFPTLVLGHAW